MLAKQALKQSARTAARHRSQATRAIATTLTEAQNNGNITALAGAAVAALAATVGISQSSNKTDCFGVVEQPPIQSASESRFSYSSKFHLKSPSAEFTPKRPTTVTSNNIDLISSRHLTGIAHTRWANSNKLENDSHSYIDSSGKIAVVHNGNLQNSKQLRRELRQKGLVFTRQTDTEVICKLIQYFRESEQLSLEQATEKALQKCQGRWGSLCVMNEENPDELVVACNGSPLVMGVEQHGGQTFVTNHPRYHSGNATHIQLKDGEMGVLNANAQTLELTKSLFEDRQVKLSPGLYPDWTLKELTEQPQAMARALGYGGRLSNDRVVLCGLEKSFDKVSKIKSVQLQGSGTSLFAAQYGEMLMKYLGSFDEVVSKDATKEADLTSTDGVICISQSGECDDIHRVATKAMENGLTVMSVVNAVGSLLARTTNLGVYCNAGRENAASSTKAFSTQVTVLALIALWFRQTRDSLEGLQEPSQETLALKEALMRLPITFGMTLTTRTQCQDVARSFSNSEQQVVVLGKGYGEPVAMEGAIKMQEIAHMEAEGRVSTVKSGSTAPVVALIFDDEHAQQIRKDVVNAKSRGAQVTIITDKPSLAQGLDEDPIVIPSNGPMTALGAVLPLQLIAYEVAMLRRINPDVPRDL